jgi:hypothetical protein
MLFVVSSFLCMGKTDTVFNELLVGLTRASLHRGDHARAGGDRFRHIEYRRGGLG